MGHIHPSGVPFFFFFCIQLNSKQLGSIKHLELSCSTTLMFKWTKLCARFGAHLCSEGNTDSGSVPGDQDGRVVVGVVVVVQDVLALLPNAEVL